MLSRSSHEAYRPSLPSRHQSHQLLSRSAFFRPCFNIRPLKKDAIKLFFCLLFFSLFLFDNPSMIVKTYLGAVVLSKILFKGSIWLWDTIQWQLKVHQTSSAMPRKPDGLLFVIGLIASLASPQRPWLLPRLLWRCHGCYFYKHPEEPLNFTLGNREHLPV